MYNRELEQLIEIAIKDGHLTEKEMRVLKNKAYEYDIDEDEIEMVVESRLADRLAETNQHQSSQSSKKEQSQKCPNCGEIISSNSGVCSSCGYVFSSTKSVDILNDLNKNYQAFCKAKRTPLVLKILKVLLMIVCCVLALWLWPIILIFAYFKWQSIKEFFSLKDEKSEYEAQHEVLMTSIKHTYGNDKTIMSHANEIDAHYMSEKRRNSKNAWIVSIGVVVIIIAALTPIFLKSHTISTFKSNVRAEKFNDAYEMIVDNPELVSPKIRLEYQDLIHAFIEQEELSKVLFLIRHIEEIDPGDFWDPSEQRKYEADRDKLINKLFELCITLNELEIASQWVNNIGHVETLMLKHIKDRNVDKALLLYNNHKDLLYTYDSQKDKDVFASKNLVIKNFLKNNGISI